MSRLHGQFVWHELVTPDAASARAFYCAVLGWQAADAHLTDRSYTYFTAGGVMAAGMLERPALAQSTARPGWIGSIGADDVDAAATSIVDAGGAVHRAAEDIPAVGRFAIMSDPQGAVFTLFTPLDRTGPPAPAGVPGQVGWHELHAIDPVPAFEFYADRFGWKKGDAINMGPMGTYQLFITDELAVGGMMTKPDTMPAPVWLFYFIVDGIDRAIERVGAAGGKVLNGPQEVPGGSWVAQCMDPQGAPFCMVAPVR